MERIRVRVFRQGNRPFLTAEWVDPLTGKLKRKSTGQKQQREAERFAARLEKDLNEGRLSDYRTTWAEFRDRYESEVVAFKSTSMAAAVSYAFGTVERIIGPKFLRGVDAGEISRLSAKLREEDRAPATIATILRTLKAALRWAARLKLIPEAPHITMPTKASEKAGGRAVTTEEFERMLDAVPAVLEETWGRPATPAEVAAWQFMLRGLWWSGLRLREACVLHWVDDRYLTVDLTGKRPLFVIQKEANKSRKDQRFPLALEFAEQLSQVPEEQRDGFVFNPRTSAGKRMHFANVSSLIARFGEKAGVVVDRKADGAAVYASAHDLRRSFGTRWAKRVLPPVLKALMRHTSIQTTMTFYVDQSAEEAADAAWTAAERAQTAPAPIKSPITGSRKSRAGA